MKRILFVCHGNICRSPMAEYVMKDLVKKAGLAAQFHIESAATSTEEIGNPVYPPARREWQDAQRDRTEKRQTHGNAMGLPFCDGTGGAAGRGV